MSDSESADNHHSIASSSDSEEQKKRQRHPDNYDPKNKLKMGKFHRYEISKPKKRAVPNKKKIRDLERLLAKTEGKMPEDVRVKKLAELKEMKKGEKSKKEAEKFESRYKKIKFFERKKIIKRLDKIEKLIKEDPSKASEMEEEKKEYKNYLVYVNNFPETKKYISLFPTEDTDKSKAERDTIMAKILKTADIRFKLREKELLEMDKDNQMLDEAE